MKKLTLILVLIMGFVLAAFGFTRISAAFATPDLVEISLPTHTPQSAAIEAALPTQTPQPSSPADLTRTDSQGAIIIEVTPRNLGTTGDTIIFEISLNTHLIDLSMDLALLATLTTDDVRTVQAVLWDAPRGGHHVSGMLSFPASLDGSPILDGASMLTLTINDVDAPTRVFSWDLKN